MGAARRRFYRGMTGNAPDQSIYFVSPTVQQMISEFQNQGRAVALHVDTTFKVVPRLGCSSQLFVLYILYKNSV